MTTRQQHILRLSLALQLLVVALLIRLDGVVGSTITVKEPRKGEMICEYNGNAVFCTFRAETGDKKYNWSDMRFNNHHSLAATVSYSVETENDRMGRIAEAEAPVPKATPREKEMATATATKTETLERVAQTTDNTARQAGPIVVGEAYYRPPYQEQYGSAVGGVLLDFHARGFNAGGLHDNDASIDLVAWYFELGHAHMDDAEYGVVFDEHIVESNHANHPKNYHIQLALQAYQWASSALYKMTSQNEFLELDPAEEGDKEKMIRLQYYAIIEFTKGEAYSLMGGGRDGDHSNNGQEEDEASYALALECYRKANIAYEKLRYLYAKLASVALVDDDDEYFNEERYFLIENFYAHSCFQLGMSLYSKLILTQNAEVFESNEKIMDLVKSSFGLEEDANEEDLVAALLDQANGGIGGGGGMVGGRGGGVGGSSSFSFSVDDVPDLSYWGATDMYGDKADAEERNAHLVEITALLDTAILTYQQHTQPLISSDGRVVKVTVNGVPRKSIQELEQDERLFEWRSSLAMAYQSAAVIATYRNQHIRSRELVNSALEIYTDVILPFYYEQEEREKRTKRGRYNRDFHRSLRMSETSSPTSITAMTRGYAEVSAGHLYVTLADTAMKFGGYEDSKRSYSQAMDWHMQHNLSPEPGGYFNTLYGDEVSLHQYEDFVTTYREELDKYNNDLKAGYIYRDDLYEAQMHLTIAPMYMAMGKARPAIRFYKDAVTVYERITTDDLSNESNKLALLSLADARFELALAYFHDRKFPESNEQHALSCDAYQRIYGEGTPPQPEGAAAIEDMKDTIIESYGEDYYEQIKAYYEGSGTGSGGVGMGNSGAWGNDPKVATNFDVLGYHNETETWIDDEL